MACCGTTNGLHDYDDWRYPRTLEWKRLVTGDDVPLLLAPSYDRPLLPATTAEVPNPLHTRSAQQWFTGLPDDTARAIMHTRRSMLREQQIVDTVMTMSPKPPCRDPRPSTDTVLRNLAVAQQHMAAMAAARGAGGRGAWRGRLAGGGTGAAAVGQRPGTAPPGGTHTVHRLGVQLGLSQPSTPRWDDPLLQPQPGGLPPPVMQIIAQQQQQQQRQQSAQPWQPARLATALRSLSPFKGSRPQSAPSGLPGGQQPQLQQHMPQYQQQQPPQIFQVHQPQHMPQQFPQQQQQQQLFPQQQQQQQLFPQQQPQQVMMTTVPHQQQQQLQLLQAPPQQMPQYMQYPESTPLTSPPPPQQQPTQAPLQPMQLQTLPTPTQEAPPDSASPSNPWYKRMWRRGGPAAAPNPAQGLAAAPEPGMQGQLGSLPQAGQVMGSPQQPLQGPQPLQMLGANPQQQQPSQQVQAQLAAMQQQGNPQLSQQQAVQYVQRLQQQQQQQQGYGPVGQPPSQQPMHGVAGGPWGGATQGAQIAPYGQQQQQQPYSYPQGAPLPLAPAAAAAAPLQPPLPPPMPGPPQALRPPSMQYHSDAGYGLDEEVEAATQALQAPLPAPPPASGRTAARTLMNGGGGGDFGLTADVAEAEAEAAAAAAPSPLPRPPPVRTAGAAAMVRGPAPLSYNQAQDPYYDVPEEPLEATAVAAEQRLGMAPPSLRRAAPARLPLASNALPAPRRLQRRPSMDGPAEEVEDVEEDFGLGAEVDAAAAAARRPVGLPPARQLAAVGGPAPEADFSFGAKGHPGNSPVSTPQKIKTFTAPTPSRLPPPRFGNSEIIEEEF